MFEILEKILNKSGLLGLFEMRVKDDNTDKEIPFIALKLSILT